MCRLLSWSSKASRRSSSCISNSCSSMRTDFLRLCSWSASNLQQGHHKKNKSIHCTQLKEVTEQDSATGKGLHTREFKAEHRNVSWMPTWHRSIFPFTEHMYQSIEKKNNIVFHRTSSKNFSFKCRRNQYFYIYLIKCNLNLITTSTTE